jgi:hypothetical protein
VKTEIYPAIRTKLSIVDLAKLIRAEGDNKTYMGGIRRLGAALNNYSQGWYTPDADPFSAAHQFGKPDYSVGLSYPGWSVLFNTWDKGDYRILETQRTVGVDGGPAKELARRIHNRLAS